MCPSDPEWLYREYDDGPFTCGLCGEMVIEEDGEWLEKDHVARLIDEPNINRVPHERACRFKLNERLRKLERKK